MKYSCKTPFPCYKYLVTTYLGFGLDLLSNGICEPVLHVPFFHFTIHFDLMTIPGQL